MSRLAGAAVIGGLLALLAANLRFMHRNWDAVRVVRIPAGAPAPDATLELLDGGRAQLAAAGKPTVLAFWATWCSPCRAELPVLDRLARSFGEQARFIAVNIEDADALADIKQFVGQAKITMPVALRGGPLADRYHVESIPHLVVLDKQGKVAEVLSGVHEEGEVAAAVKRTF
jgi:cytochrome c biogenesis protein CcmG/thiol:disulfide interchange protein DsbE